MAQIEQRSLYASPFPFKTSLDAITEFFQAQAPVNCVRMRRHAESKDFRGSVFVEFADEAAAQKVCCLRLHCPFPWYQSSAESAGQAAEEESAACLCTILQCGCQSLHRGIPQSFSGLPESHSPSAMAQFYLQTIMLAFIHQATHADRALCTGSAVRPANSENVEVPDLAELHRC